MRIVFDGIAIEIWPLAALALVILLIILWRRNPSFSYLVCLTVFAGYILLALDKTLLPIHFGGGYADALRQQPFMSRVNLIPFYFGPFGTLEGP